MGCGVEPIHVSITEPQELIVSSLFSDVSCFGLNDGSISVAVSGGVAPYQYYWLNDGSTSSSLNNLISKFMSSRV